MTGDGPKMVHFGPKGPNMAGLSTLQSGPKGTKMVNLSLFDHLGSLLGPLIKTGDGDGPKMVHLGPKMPKHGRLLNCPKWSKRDQNG